MSDHASTDSLIGGFLARLRESGEGAFAALSEQLLETPLFVDALRRTLAAKGQVDRTISGTLDLVNLPSKNDMQRIVSDVETLAARVAKQQRTLATLDHNLAVVKALVEKIAADLAREDAD
jgi:hypothetical protein